MNAHCKVWLDPQPHITLELMRGLNEYSDDLVPKSFVAKLWPLNGGPLILNRLKDSKKFTELLLGMKPNSPDIIKVREILGGKIDNRDKTHSQILIFFTGCGKPSPHCHPLDLQVILAIELEIILRETKLQKAEQGGHLACLFFFKRKVIFEDVAE